VALVRRKASGTINIRMRQQEQKNRPQKQQHMAKTNESSTIIRRRTDVALGRNKTSTTVTHPNNNTIVPNEEENDNDVVNPYCEYDRSNSNQSYNSSSEFSQSGSRLTKNPYNMDSNDPIVVASLKQTIMTSSKTQDDAKYPYTSIALSPCRNYAVAACKDKIQMIRVSSNGLHLIKTIVAGQYLQVSTSTTNPSTPASLPSSSSSQIGTIMDSSLFTRIDTKPPVSTSSATMIHVDVNDVAWSNIPYPTSSWTDGTKDIDDDYNNNTYTSIDDNNDVLPHETESNYYHTTTTTATQHASDIATANSATSSHESSKIRKRRSSISKRKYSFSRQQSDHSRGSFIAAAGSNGVILVWNAENLLDLSSTPNPSDAVRKDSSTQQQQNQVSSSSSSLFATPDAILNQYGRDVNRLAWHPTKHGILLSASQDGTVRLWERRKMIPTNNNNSNSDVGMSGGSNEIVTSAPRGGMFSALFGNMRITNKQVVDVGPIPTKTLYQWHLRTIYEPKSEAVRDIKWSPHYEDGKKNLILLITCSIKKTLDVSSPTLTLYVLMKIWRVIQQSLH
jgi:WD domain, G-beta repeat